MEGLSFCPQDDFQLVSVGRDRKIILWDTRSDYPMAKVIEGVHDDDINTIDWSPHDQNLLLTGSSDKTVSLIDL